MASSTETNSLYNQWRKTDDLFSSWINSTLKEPILAGLDTAGEAWSSLESSFASKNHDARNLQQLRIQLHHMQIGNSTITDYLSKIKNISDSLAAASQPVSGLDLVLHALRGLGPEYDGFKIAITARPSLPTFSELYDLLLQQEIQIDHDNLQRIPPPCDKPVGEEEETEKQKNGVPFTKSASSILKTADQDNGDVPKSIIKITRRVVKKDENINNVTSSVAAACDKVAAGSNSLIAGKEEVKTKFKGVLQRKGGKWAVDIVRENEFIK